MKAPKRWIQIPTDVTKRSDINSTDKLVFGEIHTLLNVADSFYMSSGSLGKSIGMNRRSVIRSLNHLRFHKLIATKVVHDSKFKHDVRRYIYDINSAFKHSDRDVTNNSDRDVTNNSDRDVTNNSDRDVTNNSDTHVTKDSDRDVTQKDYLKDNYKRLSKKSKYVRNDKPNYRSMIIKGLQALMVNINSFVADDIDNWLHDYDPKLILKAIHQVGSTSPSPTWVVKDVSTQLHRGCRTHQPRRRNNYGHAPIKEHVPDWAKDGYKPKLHRTSPKLQAKIRKQLKDLDGKNNKHEKH